ncbi:MAG: helix-turn-helix domain-containing protein [Bacteroidota bacterium]
MQIAHAAGFNSKSTFVKYFKQTFGMTPSQYRAQVSQSLKLAK